MKIINQTTDTLALKEGDAKTIVIGTVLVLAGIGVAFYAHFAPSNPLWIAIGIFVVGLVTIFASSSITVDVDKPNGQIVYQIKRVIGGKTATYATGDVLRIETRKSWRMENGNSNGRGASMPRQVLVSQSVIVFKDGQELALDHQNSASSGMSLGPAVMMGGSGKEVAIANQVATFLGVPFQEIAPPGGPMGINIGGNSGIQL